MNVFTDLDACIFDQDGTLYCNQTQLAQALSERTRDWLLSHVEPKISFQEVKNRFPNFTDALAHYSLSLSKWHLDVCDPLSNSMHQLIERDNALINFLNSLSCSHYLVTLSSQKFTKTLLNILGLENHFKKVFNLTIEDKGPAYTEILRLEQLDPSRICVFGDNLDIDLTPARIQGFTTFLVDPFSSISQQF